MARKAAASLLLALMFLTVIQGDASTAQAQSKPIQLSLVSPVQMFKSNTAIAGIRLNLIYGKNVSVTGLDWGLVNNTTSGISTGI